MKQAGLDAYNEIFKKPELVYENQSSGDPIIPEDLLIALKVNPAAFSNFINFPPSARRIYVEWLNSAKRAETRSGRISKIVEVANHNKRPGMI